MSSNKRQSVFIKELAESYTNFLQSVQQITNNLTIGSVKNWISDTKNLYLVMLLLIVIISTIFSLIYVFEYTNYSTYLSSDMGGYWKRATVRYEGKLFGFGQFVVWAPFYHIFLSYLFKIIDLLNLTHARLEAVLIFNILLSGYAVYCLYNIAYSILNHRLFSLLITFTYAFSYPIIYLKSNILSENFAIPLLIIAIWLVFTKKKPLRSTMMTVFGRLRR